MLEIVVIMQCFVDLQGKLATYCRPLERTYFSKEACDRARINLWRDGQCGTCQFDPLTRDLVGLMSGSTQVRYSCSKRTPTGWEPLEK